jgi:hypothetical protein
VPLPDQKPESLHDRALAEIRFIRSSLESAGQFTEVSGAAGIVMGVIGLLAFAASSLASTQSQWLAVWLVAAVAGTAAGFAGMVRKSRARGASLTSPMARRFALAFIPAIAAGGALTAALALRGSYELLPAVWLLLYGVAVSAGGAMSVRVVPAMGLAFLVLGVIALFVPSPIANLCLALGFGGVQIVAGIAILRRYGG